MTADQLTPQQKHIAIQRINDEMENITMSWDNELRHWHPTALFALNFASVKSLGIPAHRFIELFETEVHGIKMNVVAGLSNNCLFRSADQMNVTAKDWAEFLILNLKIAERWQILQEPIEKKVLREIEIMNVSRMNTKLGIS